MIQYRCARCGDELMLTDEMSGKEYCCPSCGMVGQVGGAPPETLQQPQSPYQQPYQQSSQAPHHQAGYQQPPTGGAALYAQQQPQPYSPQPYAQPAPTAMRENAPGAVASLVCGIISIVCACFGIVFGIIAIAQANQTKGAVQVNPGYYTGEGMAVAGKVLGIIGVTLQSIAIVINLASLAVS